MKASRRAIATSIGTRLAPMVTQVAPEMTSSFVRQALHRAIVGVGPLPAAAKAAEAQLREQDGDVEKAVHEVIENHLYYAAAQGFATNLGGLATAAVTVPANVTGLALIQCRMVAGIAHLRGYDLEDPRVRNAVLVTVLGPDAVDKLVSKHTIPGPPMALATAVVHDPTADQRITQQVGAELIARAAGKRMAATVGKKVPFVGGVVGLGADAYATWRIGRYADRELLPLAKR